MGVITDQRIGHAGFRIREIFTSVQGEGFHSGKKRTFVRFAGCNLWSGREQDRAGSCSAWCDTDFISDVRTHKLPATIVFAAGESWGTGKPDVVLTGGEPMLQLDSWAFHEFSVHFRHLAIETNGTKAIPDSWREKGLWVTVSPKSGQELVQDSGDEIKVVWPQPGLSLSKLADLDFDHRYLQPMWVKDADRRRQNAALCYEHVQRDSRWQVGHQLHKTLGVE